MFIALRVFSLAVLGVFGNWTVLLAQTPVDQTSKPPEKLPALLQPADCETVLAYIDNALLRASSAGSNVIFITKMENGSSLSLARERARYIRAYLTHRGFQNYEIASDFEGGGAPRVDLFVSGERLYSFPMTKRSAKLIQCP
jgi:hypothetical protein